MTPNAQFASDHLMAELLQLEREGVAPTDLVGAAGATLRKAVAKWVEPPARPLDEYVPGTGQ